MLSKEVVKTSIAAQLKDNAFLVFFPHDPKALHDVGMSQSANELFGGRKGGVGGGVSKESDGEGKGSEDVLQRHKPRPPPPPLPSSHL
jgi:hypothetical protein